MPNRLAGESSPYLLQHANNPVDWYPWGAEALARSRAEQRPIFLSIGYSACHWCHVMEHESFENAEIADQLNRDFVSIKVDREERPDLDQIYMAAVQLMTGRGGWPMSVFLTPDLKPFFGGTYWPPSDRHGMPGFSRVLSSVREAWLNRREQAVEQAEQITDYIAKQTRRGETATPLKLDLLRSAGAALERYFDHRHGGFGGAPKFPHPMDLRLLLRLWRRDPRDAVLAMVTLTLDKMAGGGIYDHLGGGFHRYSVDDHWLAPHFEKMLYDNALLSAAYVEAWQVTGHERYERVVRQTLDYVLCEMTSPEGGFFSTQDADSEGVEGKFFVWSHEEVRGVLGEERARTFCYVYDVTDDGNFGGHTILNLPKTIDQCAALLRRDVADLEAELADSRAALFARRSARVWPARDDKVLVSWNGLMIDAMAAAGAALSEPRYIEAAVRAADFILTKMTRPDGRLLHSWCGGESRFDAYLDDYASLANSLVTLYESTFDERFASQAVRLVERIIVDFGDDAGGGFFYTAAGHEALIVRTKDWQDSSVPSGNALAATALVRLGRLTGRADLVAAAENTLSGGAWLMSEHPSAAGQMLLALDMFIGPTQEVVIVGDAAHADRQSILDELRTRFWPNKVVAASSPAATAGALAALVEGKTAAPGSVSAYVCESFTCQAPAVGKQAILAQWDKLAPKAK